MKYTIIIFICFVSLLFFTQSAQASTYDNIPPWGGVARLGTWQDVYFGYPYLARNGTNLDVISGALTGSVPPCLNHVCLPSVDGNCDRGYCYGGDPASYYAGFQSGDLISFKIQIAWRQNNPGDNFWFNLYKVDSCSGLDLINAQLTEKQLVDCSSAAHYTNQTQLASWAPVYYQLNQINNALNLQYDWTPVLGTTFTYNGKNSTITPGYYQFDFIRGSAATSPYASGFIRILKPPPPTVTLPSCIPFAGGITKEAWVLLPSGSRTPWGTIFDIGPTPAGITMQDAGNQNTIVVGAAVTSGGTDWGGQSNGLSASYITTDTWHHVAQVVTPTTMILYVDGVERGQIGGSYDLTKANQTPYIGGSNRGYFKGYIDDVRVYAGARTQAQIQSDINRANPGSGILGWWQMNGNSIDSSGNNNNGTDNNVYYVSGAYASFNGNNSSVTLSQGFNVSGGSSLNDYITISWTPINAVSHQVVISANQQFNSPYYTKNVGSQTSTTAPNGFDGYPSLIISPNTTYYTEVNYFYSSWNYISQAASFTTPGYCAVPTPTPTPTPPPTAPPTPSISLPACISNGYNGSGITIYWAVGTNPAVTYVDISPNDVFNPNYNKAVGLGGSAVRAPDGFFNGPNGLTLNPSTTYYVRTWNGYLHSATVPFSIPSCIPDPPTGLSAFCPAPGTTASLSWNPSPGATYYNVQYDALSQNNIAGTSTTISGLAPGSSHTWGVQACNTTGCSASTSGTNFTCTIAAWIQTTTGDVHSNTGIDAPGGP